MSSTLFFVKKKELNQNTYDYFKNLIINIILKKILYSQIKNVGIRLPLLIKFESER